ncbi:hypothetical protein CCMSSC00406_0003454 [Pleurotus cornucopiae]|uniref:Uncharacterized protein n=1 Tax=Pleurotus cornucopiae TaxID=5321 RepID=A0ACB7JBU0_PLECO|nr:hypothetical protein CCMSSC00406_0003454 [Pleurotus cornucopiae]
MSRLKKSPPLERTSNTMRAALELVHNSPQKSSIGISVSTRTPVISQSSTARTEAYWASRAMMAESALAAQTSRQSALHYLSYKQEVQSACERRETCYAGESCVVTDWMRSAASFGRHISGSFDSSQKQQANVLLADASIPFYHPHFIPIYVCARNFDAELAHDFNAHIIVGVLTLLHVSPVASQKANNLGTSKASLRTELSLSPPGHKLASCQLCQHARIEMLSAAVTRVVMNL